MACTSLLLLAPTWALATDARVGACLNLGNHLEATREGAWGRALADDDFTAIAAAGFRTVRLPVNFSGHAQADAPYAIDAAFMDRVVHLVDAAQAAHLAVIIDLHNYDALLKDPPAHAQRLAALWRQVAARFKGYPQDVWFELFNEPHEQFDNGNLMATLGPSLAAVRETNPTRTVVIGGGHWSGVGSLATLELPDDPAVIATFHYYEPFAFTHQGAGWVHPSPPLGVHFGGEADRERLARDVAQVRDYMQRTHRAVFMGEYGAYDSVPLPERAAWYGAVHDAYAAIGVDGCAWAYVNTFPLRGSGGWHQPILEAIGLGKH